MAQRFDFCMPVECVLRHGGSASGRVVNISTSGALIKCAIEKAPIDEVVTLFFPVLRGATSLAVTSRIVRHTDDGFAVKFKAPSPRFVAVIRQMMPKLGDRTEGAWRFRRAD